MKMAFASRFLVVLCAFTMGIAYYTSVWRIELEAPQYPEGLSLEIWVNGVRGNVESINNLNHYIGMAQIHEEDFPEFKVLPVLLALMIIFGVIAGLAGKRKWLLAWISFLVLVAVVASVDFWLWEYKYGHNLDPHAAIKVPGMSYQPPFIGYKELLNFLAGSLPATGGYAIIIPSVIAATVWGYEYFIRRKRMIT